MADWPLGWGRVVLDEADSTNAVLARSDAPAPIWCLALNQTAGVGRRGRAWAFQKGNFAASVRIAPRGGIEGFARHSFVAALALHDVLSGIGAARPVLKWPNDVLLGGRKCCGILLETVNRAGRAELIAGFGVNLAHAPAADAVEPGATPPGSIAGLTGETPGPEAFLDRLAPAFAARLAEMERDGFGATRAAWLERATGLGQRITARLPHATHEGVFEGLDADGALILLSPSGRLVLPAADVYFAPS